MIGERNMQILGSVTREPETATEIYRRWAGLPVRSSLSTRRRKERRWLATHLERLADQGYLDRSRGDSEGHPVPTFTLSQLGCDALGRAA